MNQPHTLEEPTEPSEDLNIALNCITLLTRFDQNSFTVIPSQHEMILVQLSGIKGDMHHFKECYTFNWINVFLRSLRSLSNSANTGSTTISFYDTNAVWLTI